MKAKKAIGSGRTIVKQVVVMVWRGPVVVVDLKGTH